MNIEFVFEFEFEVTHTELPVMVVHYNYNELEWTISHAGILPIRNTNSSEYQIN